MTASVPPSAARAAKLSAARAARRSASAPAPTALDTVKASDECLLQQQQLGDDDVKRQQRWYMGQYGAADGT